MNINWWVCPKFIRFLSSSDMIRWAPLMEWTETKSINNNNFGSKVSFV
jgi:hypothetical protein